ncbi:MAG: hypothetical protein M3R03_06160, partial [Pseudomonadota bacterium]|nr:hypothetical protein [Pseudomonadota bacterium]
FGLTPGVGLRLPAYRQSNQTLASNFRFGEAQCHAAMATWVESGHSGHLRKSREVGLSVRLPLVTPLSRLQAPLLLPPGKRRALGVKRLGERIISPWPLAVVLLQQ